MTEALQYPEETVCPLYKKLKRNLPGGPVIKNPPRNAGDMQLLSPHNATKGFVHHNDRFCMMQLRLKAAKGRKREKTKKTPYCLDTF